MRLPLTLAAGLFFHLAGAQQALPYGAFLATDTSIRWAVEADVVAQLVPRTVFGNLGPRYRARLDAGTLRTYTVDSVRRTVTARMATPGTLQPVAGDPAIVYRVYRSRSQPYRSLLDTLAPPSAFCDSCRPGLELYGLRQLVYYRNGAFHVDNILLSPLGRIRGTDGSLAWASWFATSFNPGGPAPDTARGLVFLGRLPIDYELPLNDPPGYKTATVLTPRVPAPLPLLLEDAARGKLRLYKVVDEGEAPTIIQDFVKTFTPLPDTVLVNSDAPGEKQYVVTQSIFDPNHFSALRIDQSFYYDPARDVLLSRVNKVFIRKEIRAPNGNLRGTISVAYIPYREGERSGAARLESPPAVPGKRPAPRPKPRS